MKEKLPKEIFLYDGAIFNDCVKFELIESPEKAAFYCYGKTKRVGRYELKAEFDVQSKAEITKIKE